MSVIDLPAQSSDAQAVEKIPAAVFDAGAGKDFDEVYISGLKTPDGLFACDGAALIHEDWCDEPVLDRIEHADHRTVSADWWRRMVHTRKSNIVDGFPQVTVRPFYELTVTAAGGSMSYRSAGEEAVILLDADRRVRGLIGGMVSPYSPRALSDNYRAVVHLIEVFRRQVPNMHPHHAALAALVSVDERAGAGMVQQRPRVEVAQ